MSNSEESTDHSDNTAGQSVSGKGLSFTDNISITWKAVDAEPDDVHLALISESNEAFLRAVAAIGEHARDGEEPSGLNQELARLDLKLNLLLDLVSQLVYRQLALPEVTRVTLTSTEISWQAPAQQPCPVPGSRVFIQVYVQRGTPKPLSFYGEVVSASEEYDRGYARVRYLGLSTTVKDWIEKLIFRHHRRQVAYSKLSK